MRLATDEILSDKLINTIRYCQPNNLISRSDIVFYAKGGTLRTWNETYYNYPDCKAVVKGYKANGGETE